MRPVLASVILSTGLAAFACYRTANTAGAKARVSDGSAVGGCEYLGDFVGGFAAKPGAGWWEVDQVRKLAAEGGATDVVLDTKVSGHLIGKGYRCP